MYKYVCEWCGKEREAKYKSQSKRFCSVKCASEYKWTIRKRSDVEFTCIVCGKKFFCKSYDNRLREGKEIKYCSHDCAGIATRTGKEVECLYCGNKFYSTRAKFCCRKCVCEYRKMHSEHLPYEENGYLSVYVDGYNKKNNAKQHRLVMETYLGRRLDKDEVVHHINGDTKDNRIENLVVMSRGDHSRLHREIEKENGKEFFGRQIER